MRGIAYDRIKRGALLTGMGVAFVLPAAAAQARPSVRTAVYVGGSSPVVVQAHSQQGSSPVVVQAHSQQGSSGHASVAKITGHKIG